MADGLPGGTSFMEDYTYHLAPGEEQILGAHMLEVCPTIAAGTPDAARSTRSASAAARTRSGWCSTPRPAPRVVVGIADMGDRFRLVANEVDVVAPDAPLPKLPVARAVWEPGAGPARPRPRRWLTAGGPHHTVLSTARRHRGPRGLRRDARHRAAASSTPTPRRAGFTQELRWNQAYYRLAQGF